MGALDEALKTIHMCLRPGGRLVVLSYHSLEDRRIKNLFKTGMCIFMLVYVKRGYIVEIYMRVYIW